MPLLVTPVSSPENRDVDHDDFNDYIDVDDYEYDDSDVIDDEYGDVNDDKTGIERVLKCNSCFFMMVSFIMARIIPMTKRTTMPMRMA